jgi:hypothetical protein
MNRVSTARIIVKYAIFLSPSQKVLRNFKT